MTEFTSEEIKNRLSNIGEAIGNIALEYITKLEEENEQVVKYCKELEAGFLNYKKNYKTKRQKVFDLETRVRNFEKENEQLKKELLTYKNSICNKECAEVWGESERLKEENEQLKQQLTKGRDILFECVKIACGTFSEGCPGCDYCFLGEVKQKAEVFFKELDE